MLILQLIGLFIMIVVLTYTATKSVEDIHDFMYYTLAMISFIITYFIVKSMDTPIMMVFVVFVVLLSVIRDKK